MRADDACRRRASAVAQPAGPAPAITTSNSVDEFTSTLPDDYAHSIQVIVFGLHLRSAAAAQHLQHLLPGVRAANGYWAVVARQAAAKEWKAEIDQRQM